jgi:hypothetical protein
MGFVGMFAALTFVKVFHWLVQVRLQPRAVRARRSRALRRARLLRQAWRRCSTRSRCSRAAATAIAAAAAAVRVFPARGPPAVGLQRAGAGARRCEPSGIFG